MAGYQINRLQCGEEPADWKPLNIVGKGVREIRIRAADGTFRVVYVAKFEDAIYVLHCFQKTTQKTDQRDLDLAHIRFAELVKELGKT